MSTLSTRSLVCNAAAVFSGSYGAVTRRAEQAGCSRQTLYKHARRIERRLQTPESTPVSTSASGPAADEAPAAGATLDEATRRRFAATAFAMGVSLRQIEDLLRVVLDGDGPDHATIGRWVADAAEKAGAVLEALDAACVARVRTLAVDEIFFGGGRPWSGSSRRA